jgi:hypothetical protein
MIKFIEVIMAWKKWITCRSTNYDEAATIEVVFVCETQRQAAMLGDLISRDCANFEREFSFKPGAINYATGPIRKLAGVEFKVIAKDMMVSSTRAAQLAKENENMKLAIRDLYCSGWWTSDRLRPEVEDMLWKQARDAAGLPPGSSPVKLGGK